MRKNKFEQAGEVLLRENNAKLVRVRRTMSGVAYRHTTAVEGKWEFASPLPKTAISFAVFAHEVGHIHQFQTQEKTKPRWKEEYDAEMFAIACFKHFGFTIPHIVLNRIRWHIAYALAKALNRGMKKLPDELKAYRKYLIRVGYRGPKNMEVIGYTYYAKNFLWRRQ